MQESKRIEAIKIDLGTNLENIDLSYILYRLIYILLLNIYSFNLMINNILNLLMTFRNYMILSF